MGTKFDKTVGTESHMNSVITTSSPKVSKFGSKSGFVIPKNKLSGSLVPAMRCGGKGDPEISLRDESSKKNQRKTKWGVDMTQDAAVKKGRILAYQSRLEQLTEQLKGGLLEFGNDKSLKSLAQSSTRNYALEQQNLEQLEIEKRDIIGEILQLNPGFKAPSDYQPLLKEAKVPIPIKVYPECNFIRLLLGSESNTQKRLEEETGAKVVVYGTKSDTKEKHEITQSELSEIQTSYEELYVQVSADTYNKVDAAVALLELLLTPVSGKSSSSTESKVIATESADVVQSQMQSSSSYMTLSVSTSQVATQSVPAEPGPMMYQDHRYHSYPITSAGPSLPPPSQFTPAVSNNSVRFSPPLFNPSNRTPPLYGGNSSFGMVPMDSAGVGGGSQTPLQVLQQPTNQATPLQMSTYPMSAQYSTIPAPFPASNISRFFENIPGNRSGPPQSQPPSMDPLGSLPMHLGPSLIPGNSNGWPSVPPITPVGPNNFRGGPLPVSLPPREILRPGTVGRPAMGVYAGGAALSSQSSSGAPLFSSAVTHFSVNNTLAPPVASSSNSLLPAPGQPPTFLPSLVPRPWPMPAISSNSVLANVSSAIAPQVPAMPMQTASLLPQIAQVSTSMVSSSLARPPRPNPGDFTFQPLRAQDAGLLTPSRPDNLLTSRLTAQVPESTMHPNPVPQPLPAKINSQVLNRALHAPPPYRPPMQNPPLQTGGMALPRPHGASMFDPTHAPFPPSPSSAVNNFGEYRPICRPLHFPNSQISIPVNQFNIRPSPGFLSLRTPQNLMPLQKPLIPPAAQQQHGFLPPPNQNLGNNVVLGPLGNHVYDPFSPTSNPNAHPQKKNEQAKLGNPEPDSEYEDLMASVGVR